MDVESVPQRREDARRRVGQGAVEVEQDDSRLHPRILWWGAHPATAGVDTG
jgi:hypothetical protein